MYLTVRVSQERRRRGKILGTGEGSRCSWGCRRRYYLLRTTMSLLIDSLLLSPLCRDLWGAQPTLWRHRRWSSWVVMASGRETWKWGWGEFNVRRKEGGLGFWVLILGERERKKEKGPKQCNFTSAVYLSYTLPYPISFSK